MRQTDAFFCFWHLCSKCNQPNSVQVYSHLMQNGWKCQSCKELQDIGMVMEHCTMGDPPIPDPEKFRSSAEFLCECGRKNVFFLEVIEERIPDDESQMYFQCSKIPKYGLCEDCLATYNLIFPKPEMIATQESQE